MKRSSLMLAAACIAMLPVTGHADDKNGNSANRVMQGCRDFIAKTSEGLFNQGLCVGAINAIGDFVSGQCIPQDVTVNQAVRVVVAYVDGQPARLHEDFNVLAVEAVRNAWPCR
jgi:hypothetical protein